MAKSLLLTGDANSYPSTLGVEIAPIYMSHSKPLRLLRFLHHKIGLMMGYKYLWLGGWRNKLTDYKEIVIEDSIFDYYPLEYIRSNNSDIRIVCCFRNRVKEHIDHSIVHRQPEELRERYGCELWSYSQDDCDKYGMTKYNQFHLIPKELSEKEEPIEQDVYFIGEDKHRIGRLMDLKQKLEQKGLKAKIGVVADPHMQYTAEERKLITTAQPYQKVLENVLHSRCIIDIVGKVNYGMTYRSLEAAVLKKKLITNYVDIKDVDFYNKKNIFILGVDDETGLRDFVMSPFDSSINDKLEAYSFQYFCKRIFNYIGSE